MLGALTRIAIEFWHGKARGLSVVEGASDAMIFGALGQPCAHLQDIEVTQCRQRGRGEDRAGTQAP